MPSRRFAPRPTLHLLPIDVLLTIRDIISDAPFAVEDPSLGLFAHVALSRTCRRLRGMYHFPSPESEQRFWKHVCVSAGFGRPMRREYPHELRRAPPAMSWRKVATLAVAHERVCEIRSCREANLWFAGSRKVPTHTHLPTTAPKLAFHPLFYYLHFSPTAASLDPCAILYTHLPTHPDCRFKVYAPLAAHPSASCAFATYPPVRKISFLRPGDDENAVIASVFNPDGVTILDVNRLLADILPRNLMAMRTVLSHYQSLIDDYRSASSSFAETMARGRHRGFLGDHRYVRFLDPVYPYVDMSSADAGRSLPAGELPLGPFTVRCDSGGRRVGERQLHAVLAQA